MVSPSNLSTPLGFGLIWTFYTVKGKNIAGLKSGTLVLARSLWWGWGVCLFLACVFACVRVLCSLARLNAFILPVLCRLDKIFKFRPFARSCPLLRLQMLASDNLKVPFSLSPPFPFLSLTLFFL